MIPGIQFDPLVVASNWLDACKARRLAEVIDFFAEDATLECACASDGIFFGRDDLETYWRPRLADPSPMLFEFEQVWLDATGASLAYRSHDRKIIQIHFSFNDLGKIEWSRCAPMS